MTEDAGGTDGRGEGSGGDADRPSADEQYHLEVGSNDVADTVLLPGDPGRTELIAGTWDAAEEVASHREYRTFTGTYRETPVSVTSTGIGSPAAVIALEELARVGADTLIRVGSCGALREEVAIGDLVITTGGVRQEGTGDAYVRKAYPAVADGEVVSALVAAAERLGYDYHVGVTASTDSFYVGQGRPGFEGYEPPESEALLEELRAAGVTNFEMEASALLTVAGVYGLRAGAVCTVYANRATDEFRVEGQRRAAECASLAAHLLERMDEQVAAAGAERWHPGLALDDGR